MTFFLSTIVISDIHNPKWKTIPDIQNVILNILKYILTSKNAITDIRDIFTSQNVFLDIQNYIVMHFGYLKWKLWLVTIGLKISVMGVFPSKNSIADIQNVHSRYPECNCGYLKLKAQYTWMAKVTSFVLGRMSLWISEMIIVDRKNVIVDIGNVLFDQEEVS